MGLHRVAEVLLVCFVGIVVAWRLARVWPLREPGGKDTAGKGAR
jgi:hypothetical protein